VRRTDQQRKSIEVYCREVAEALNDAGYDLKTVLDKKAIETPCTQENIKENVFKKIETALFSEKTSTTQLDSREVNDVYEVFNRWLGQEFEVHVPFPCEESLSDEPFK